MKSSRGAWRAADVGLAISPTRLCAHAFEGRWADPPDGGAWHRDLPPLAGSDAEWTGLRESLDELREVLGGRAGTAAVALLPPLVHTRRLDLPRLRDDDLRAVLRRDAARYFLGAREPQAVGAVRLERRRTSPATVLAAATPLRLLDAVLSAAAGAGWTVTTVVPAWAAWGAAAGDLWPRLHREGAMLFVATEAGVELLDVRGEIPVPVRRFPSAAAMQGPFATALSEPALQDGERTALPVALAGSPEARRVLEAALQQQHVPVVGPDTNVAIVDAPDKMAACYATRALGPEVLPEHVHAARRRRALHAAGALAVVAVLLITLAAAVHLWGLQRELDAVLAQRAVIRPHVSEVMQVQALIDQVDGRVATVRAAADGAPRWASAVADIAENLPRDAYLTTLRARADTLQLGGMAVNAAAVFEGMWRTRRLENVQADGPIQRQPTEGVTHVERFSLSARLHPPAAVGVAQVRP